MRLLIHSFPNFNGENVDIGERMGEHIPRFYILLWLRIHAEIKVSKWGLRSTAQPYRMYQ